MPNYTISDQVIQLSSLYSNPYQVRNSGQKTVYLGADTSVSPNHYDWSLQPGDTLGFSAQTNLYLVCAPGETSTLEQQYGANGNFTPAPSTVYSKLKNSLTVLDAETLAVPSTATPVGIFGQIRTINVEDYASILITVDCQSTSHAGFIPTIENNIQGSFSFGDTNPPTTIQNNWITPQWLLIDAIPTIGNGFQASYIQLPVTGKYLTTQFNFTKKATLDSGQLTTTILGSNQSITKPDYLSCGYGLVDDLIMTGQFYLSHGSGSPVVPLATKNLPISIAAFRANTATSHSTSLKTWVNGVEHPVTILRETPTEYSGNLQSQLPLTPIIFNSAISGTPSTVQSMITM